MQMHTRLLIPTLLVAAAFASTGGALPTTCEDPCTVLAATPGYAAPAVSIESGAQVIWESIDVTHPTGEAFPDEYTCFIASTAGGMPADPITFVNAGGVLTADGVPCTGATFLETGEAVLPFRCLLHPNMVGTLVVS